MRAVAKGDNPEVVGCTSVLYVFMHSNRQAHAVVSPQPTTNSAYIKIAAKGVGMPHLGVTGRARGRRPEQVLELLTLSTLSRKARRHSLG